MNGKQTIQLQDDYIFRYPVCEANNRRGDRCKSRLDLVKRHLQNLLQIVIPCDGGSEVKIDGFKLMNDRGIIHRLFDQHEEDANQSLCKKPGSSVPDKTLIELEEKDDNSARGEKDNHPCSFQSMKNATLYEPTIEYIERQLESLLDLVDLESSGKPLTVDGFRLKDLSQWVEDSPCDPADMLGYVATRCNCNCVFCYNNGSPPSLALVSPSRSPEEEFKEVQTRLKYFSPGKGRDLFPSLGTCFEAFLHPYFKDVLEGIRKKSDRLIRVSTNGTTLTQELVDYLSAFNPVHLDVALHSSSPLRRQRLMRDKTPETAIKSLSLLRKAGVVYDIVIVPWPDGSLDEMLDDMETTIDYAEENHVRLIQISLPGYSRYFSEKELFNRDYVWEAITGKVRDIRCKTEVPIVTRPAVYEEGLFCNQKNLPEVIGVVKGSPAFYGGLQTGDILKKVGSNLVRNRPQALVLLSILQQSGMESVTIQVLRHGRKLNLSLNLNRFSYPYSKHAGTHLGVVFMGAGLKTGYLETLRELIEEKGAKKILLLTSVLMKPLLEQIIRESLFFGGGDLHIDIRVPPNRFFGGNICMGDLLVVQDYIDYIISYKRSTGIRPELVVIPSSPFHLSGWGRDLTGRVYLDIERQTCIPVEILECQTIYD